MKKILAVMPFAEKHRTYLESLAKDCSFTWSSIKTVTPEQAAEADIILGNVPVPMVRENRHLEWMQLNSAGADAYCRPGVLADSTVLTCATGAYGLTVSEHMLTLTMMLCRKADLYAKHQAECVWVDEGRVSSVWGSVVLVIGLGDIGSEYASRVKALGAHVIGVKRTASAKPDCVDELYTWDQLDTLLPRADIVAMAVPGTPETEHMIDERRLRLMKQGAYLINAGRGSAVDCDALDRVLREGGVLGGCGMDVTDPEPLPPEHPLWTAPRAIVTPHVAGKFNLPETFERIVRITGGNLERFLAGDVAGMRNLVDRSTGYRKAWGK